MKQTITLLILIAVAVAAMLACTGGQSDAPEEWITYQHSRDRQQSAGCAERPNFTFDVPASWKREMADCDEVGFSARKEDAGVIVRILDLPSYATDPRTALGQMENEWSRERHSGASTFEVKVIEQHGWPALSRARKVPASTACERYSYELSMPARSWRTHGQRAVVAWVIKCTDAPYEQSVAIQAVLKSFRLIEPY